MAAEPSTTMPMTRSAPDLVPKPCAQGFLSHWLHSPFLHEHGLGYALAVAATGLAFALSFMLAALANEPVRYLLFVPAVLISAIVGGLGPGLFATGLGAVLGLATITSNGELGASEWVNVVVFTLVGA